MGPGYGSRVGFAVLALTAGGVGSCPARAAEERPWSPSFAGLDLDGDGRLTGAEKEPVASFDADGDGLVTEEEFRTGCRRLTEGVGGRLFGDFAALDRDGDQTLAAAEAAGLDPAVYSFDRDGRLSFEEFAAGRRREEMARAALGTRRVVVVDDAARQPVLVADTDVLRFPVELPPDARLIPRVRGPAILVGMADEMSPRAAAAARRRQVDVALIGAGDVEVILVVTAPGRPTLETRHAIVARRGAAGGTPSVPAPPESR